MHKGNLFQFDLQQLVLCLCAVLTVASFNSCNKKVPVEDLIEYEAIIDKIYHDTLTAEQEMRYIEQAIALNPKGADAYWLRGNHNYYQMYLEGKMSAEEVIADFSKAIECAPSSAYSYSSRGKVYYENRDFESALSDFNTAIALNTLDKEAYLIHGYLMISQGYPEEAISDFDKVIELASTSNDEVVIVAYHCRAGVKCIDGNISGALSDIFTIIKMLEPDHVCAVNCNAVIEAFLKEREELKNLEFENDTISKDITNL